MTVVKPAWEEYTSKGKAWGIETMSKAKGEKRRKRQSRKASWFPEEQAGTKGTYGK